MFSPKEKQYLSMNAVKTAEFLKKLSEQEKVFLLEKRARHQSIIYLGSKHWEWRTFKFIGQSLEYYKKNELKGTFNIAGCEAKECNSFEGYGKTYPFSIKYGESILYLNASSEYVRQKCLNILNRAATDFHWNNPEKNFKAEMDIQAILLNIDQILYTPSPKKNMLDLHNSVEQAAKIKTNSEEWRLFAKIDTDDEAEMLTLAVFMETLLSCAPKEVVHDRANDTVFSAAALSTQKIVLEGSDGLKDDSDVSNFDIEAECITKSVAAGVVDFCRIGGTHLISHSAITTILKSVSKILQQQPNVQHISVLAGTRLTVVGDLHGQLGDLLHILDRNGVPSQTNKFLFNGDFVDRGTESVEVVVIIFALLVAYGPEVVYLNRGNHEEITLARVYGFAAELKDKYESSVLFDMFIAVFNDLPLSCVINGTVFVVHGGLFHTSDVLLEDIAMIHRKKFILKPKTPYPENTVGKSSEEQGEQYLRQLQRDMMWSDPMEQSGAIRNTRGAGAMFGPDVAAEWMELNQMDMVIRSHELVQTGFSLPYAAYEQGDDPSEGMHYGDGEMRHSDDCPFLVTLFSASNYSGSNNEGAIMMFEQSITAPASWTSVGGRCDLSLYVHHYRTSITAHADIKDVNAACLQEKILKKRTSLLTEFSLADETGDRMLPLETWATIMTKITKISAKWLSLTSVLVPAAALDPSGFIQYDIFLDSFSLGDEDDKKALGEQRLKAFNNLYGQCQKLEAAFIFFDSNGHGSITMQDFQQGCNILNERLPLEDRLTDLEEVYKLMDLDGDGLVHIDEFFETFRLLDVKATRMSGRSSFLTDRSSLINGSRFSV